MVFEVLGPLNRVSFLTPFFAVSLLVWSLDRVAS